MTGQELKDMRLKLKITRKAAAEAVKVSDRKLSQFEDGAEGVLTVEQAKTYEIFLDCKDTGIAQEEEELPLAVGMEEPADAAALKEQAVATKEKRKKDPVKPMSKRSEELQRITDALVLPDNFIMVDTVEKLKQCAAELAEEEIRVVDTETYGDDAKQAKNSHRAKFCGISLWLPNANKGYWVPVASNYMKCLPVETIRLHLNPVLSEASVSKFDCHVSRRLRKRVGEDNVYDMVVEEIPVPYKLITHNYKFDAHVLRYVGISLPVPWFDTLIAAWLLDENDEHNLKMLWNKYCCTDPAEMSDKFSTLFGDVTMEKVMPKLATYYSVKDVKMTYELMLFQKHQFDNNSAVAKIADIFWYREMPVLGIAYRSEVHGMPVDVSYLRDVVSPKLHQECADLYNQILEIYVREGLKTPEDQVAAVMQERRLHQVYKKNGDPYSGKGKWEGFNLNSNPQKQEFIYDLLKIPEVPKQGRSLNTKKVLKKLKSKHAVIDLLMKYNAANKLASAFADTLPRNCVLGDDGVYRVFPNINTIGAKTGRMSCSNPNIQQIPSRVGELIRNAFIADKGSLLLSTDFSQQELRVLADISDDEVMKQAFFDKKDMHSLTASTVLGQQLIAYQKAVDDLIAAFERAKDTGDWPIKRDVMAKILADMEKDLHVLPDGHHDTSTNQRIKELCSLSLVEMLDQLKHRRANMGNFFAMGSNYELFEIIRNKMTRVVTVEKISGKEVEHITGVRPVEECIKKFAYLSEDKVRELYEIANALPNDDLLELAHFFEKRRKDAKVLNFGIVYGMSKYGLSDALEIDTDTAEAFIKGYLSGYPGIMRAMRQTHLNMQRSMWVENKAGRKRRFYPEFKKMAEDKTMKWLMGSCQRQSFNFLVQSYSADMTKQAMIDVQPIMDRIGGLILMAVHDELLFMVPATITKDDIREIQSAMQNAIPLCVPMGSDAEIGTKWGECKSVSDVADFLSLVAELGGEDDDGSSYGKPDEDDEEAGQDTSYFEVEDLEPNEDDPDHFDNHQVTPENFPIKPEVKEEPPMPEAKLPPRPRTFWECPYCGHFDADDVISWEEEAGMSIFTCSKCQQIYSEQDARHLTQKEVELQTMGIEALQFEVMTIKTPGIKAVVTEILQLAPKYFWSIPSSSSGKYHPNYALGDGGLVRHIKAGMKIMEDLFQNKHIMLTYFPDGVSDMMKDCIRGAYLIHDCCKSGLNDIAEKHTRVDHPLLVRELTTKLKPETLMNLTDTEKAVLSYMMKAVASHMGQWTTDFKGTPVLEEPASGLERFVHTVDYLASRKFLEVNFDV